MNRLSFDEHPARDFELTDIMLGPCPLLAAVEADNATERAQGIPLNSLQPGWEWKPITKAQWATRKRHAINVGIHVFWSMQVNHWMKGKVC